MTSGIQSQNLAQVCANVKEGSFYGYRSSLSTGEIFTQTVLAIGVVGATTTIGVIAGSTIGAVVIPVVGAVPGAVAGGIAGGAVGVGLCAGYVVWEYKGFYKITTAQNREHIFTLLRKETGIGNCPISQDFPIHPVVLSTNSKMIYEEECLRKWVREKGTDPISLGPVTLNDIHVSTEALKKICDVCRASLAIPNPDFTKEQNKGLKVLADETNRIFKHVFNRELDHQQAAYNNGSIDDDQMAASMRGLADVISSKKPIFQA